MPFDSHVLKDLSPNNSEDFSKNHQVDFPTLPKVKEVDYSKSSSKQNPSTPSRMSRSRKSTGIKVSLSLPSVKDELKDIGDSLKDFDIEYENPCL